MNEFKILITAANSAAKKAIKEVKDEIDKTQKKAKQGGKSISDSMKAVAKGAAVAVGAIAAVTTALVAFGKSSLEAQKNISKLNTAFLAAGSTTKQAGKTYQDLYRFMGDSGAATEAAQQLALITTNEKDLAQWTKILQGVYATMGSTLPIESLAEAANETINVGQVTGSFADALNWAKVSEDEFNARLAQTTSLSEREVLVRSTLNSIYMNAANIYERNNQAMLAYNQSQAQMDVALARAGQAVMPLMTAVNNLATTLLNSLSPAIAVVCQMIAILVGWITTAVSWISSFFSLFSGGGSKAKDTTKEVANNVGKVGAGAKAATGGVGGLNKALGGAAKAAKELKRQTMGFDELNVVSKQEVASGGGGAAAGGGGGGITMPDLSSLTEGMPSLDEFTKELENAKGKAEALLVLIGSIGIAIGLWKLTNFLKDVDGLKEALKTVGGKVKTISGIALIVAGAFLLIQGYTDAWVNGLDWGNFATILAGIALTVGGLALAFGPVAAGVGLVAGGIALLVLGIKDLVDNGFSMEAMLAVVTGVVLTCVGAVLLFNAALLANPITWIVIAIAALVAAIAICIIYWDDVKEAAVNAWNKIKEWWEKVATWFDENVIQPMANFFTDLWNDIVEIFGNIKEWFSEKFTQAWEGIQTAWSAVVQWFSDLWASICEVFATIKEWFSTKFTEAWTAICEVFATVKTWFEENVWNKIVEVFDKAQEWFKTKFTDAWTNIKDVFKNVKTWFTDEVWGKVKEAFGIADNVKNWFKDKFKGALEAVKAVFTDPANGIKSFFEGIWGDIKTTFTNLGTNIGDAIGGAVKSGINSVIGWIEDTINKAIGLINGAIDLINKIPAVNVGKLSKLSLPRLAKGGVVDSATIAMIGEQGKEAVIPLENNTQWMDKLVDRIVARSNNPTKVILKVGEKELGWATIGAINGITEQTGGLQLQL